MNVRQLVGSGDRIGLVTFPVVAIGVIANVAWPAAFSLGGPPELLRFVSVAVLFAGVVLWIWSAALIVIEVPRHHLITSGPFALARHPLYSAVALLVVPWAGFLLDTWLGAVIGIALYLAARRFEGDEEVALAREFGPAWQAYRTRILLPWV